MGSVFFSVCSLKYIPVLRKHTRDFWTSACGIWVCEYQKQWNKVFIILDIQCF